MEVAHSHIGKYTAICEVQKMPLDHNLHSKERKEVASCNISQIEITRKKLIIENTRFWKDCKSGDFVKLE